MQNLKSATLTFGSVLLIPDQPAQPDQSETRGNLTVNVVGKPGKPPRWMATYTLNCEFESDAGRYTNVLGWTVQLPAENVHEARYFEVEAEGSRQIAPMLRAVANEIEKVVAQYDSELARDFEEQDRPA